jgi:hypothetical protein
MRMLCVPGLPGTVVPSRNSVFVDWQGLASFAAALLPADWNHAAVSPPP